MAVIFTASWLLLSGCKKESIKDPSSDSLTILGESNASASGSDLLMAELQALLDEGNTKFPGTLEQIRQKSAALQGDLHPEYRDMVSSVLNVAPTPCNSSTALRLWLSNERADWTSQMIAVANNLDMFNLPGNYALVFENNSAGQYHGLNGEYTQIINKSYKDLRRFWNIQSSDIILAAMHGNMLTDLDKITNTYRVAYELSAASAAFYANVVINYMNIFPLFRNGNHPIFTFNAYAYNGYNSPGLVIPKKIIMGDGIMEGYAAIGFEDVAPQAILAHEYGHHIQYQLNLIPPVRNSETIRKIELMADAYAAYYLSHARGAAMQWKRVEQFLDVFFNIGDCSFNSNNHHGTPTQRMAAAEWAYNLANDAQKQGHILTVEEFTALFDAVLPELVIQ